MLLSLPRGIALLVTLLLLQVIHAQILLQSGFENWQDGLPLELNGDLGDHPLGQVSASADTLHSGGLSLRLALSEGTTSQLSTTDLAVDANELYDVRIWVRGTGRLRIGVNDGRPETDGYGPFNLWVNVHNDTSWRQVLQRVQITNTTTDAQVVFSLRGDGPNDRLFLDDVTISHSALPTPTMASIQEIQESTSFFGFSPLEYQFVRTSGVVTGLANTSFYIQDGPGPWSGLAIMTPPPTELALGDSVSVLATVSEFGGGEEPWSRTRTQLIVLEQLIIHSSGHPEPIPETLSAVTMQQEQWEGVLVQIMDLECLSPPLPLVNEWSASNWQGSLVVDDLFHLFTGTPGSFYSITGVAHYEGSMKLAPRRAEDVLGGVGIDDRRQGNLLNVHPNPASERITIRTGLSGPWSWSMMDHTGRSVMNGRSTQPVLTVDVQHLDAGPYLVLLDGRTPGVLRFVVH